MKKRKKSNINEFLKINNIKYKNINNFIKAFTHKSYAFKSGLKEVDTYERLEFLGDAILNGFVSKYVFERNEDLLPGELTLIKWKVLNKENLCKNAKKLNMDEYMLVSNSISKVTDSILEDAFESLCAAIYLENGDDGMTEFLEKTLFKDVKNTKVEDLGDQKSKLQEYLQLSSRGNIKYKVMKHELDRKTNDHKFKVSVFHDNIKLGSGTAKTKKNAEQIAASNALQLISKKEEK